MTTATKPAKYERTQQCVQAAISDGRQLGGDASAWHGHCPIAIRMTRPVKSANNVTTGAETYVAICSCTCHVEPGQSRPAPRCTECYNENSEEVDPDQWLCIDRDLCSTRVSQRLEKHPLIQNLRAATADGVERRRERKGKTMVEGAPTTDKPKREPKPKAGSCHHCGAPTKGGQFIPGHDAKMKGELTRIAVDVNRPDEDRINAMAEQIIRKWDKSMPVDALTKGFRGIGDDDEARTKNLREQREHVIQKYERLHDQAEKRAKDNGLLDRLVKQRVSNVKSGS